ncbi:predicted protein [Naegleria gruberi]|uniref:Predicted protein n=1 Tax=Naegleria gruberi TaxID=5762 RepID=D2VKL5_NAEGR|nr:uncharacterized protein NAEGRDRAFT_80325 [Naegleria gruberi]EFC42711.1 predicted protein [Naegleria gruberi]|eukprot:XP_002675455.1 predicted protein [Naegleria gruberi strain NEG-M]
MLTLIMVDEVDDGRIIDTSNCVRTTNDGEAFSPLTALMNCESMLAKQTFNDCCSDDKIYEVIRKGLEFDEQFISEEDSDADYSCESSSEDETEDEDSDAEEECPLFLLDSSFYGKRNRCEYDDYYSEDDFEDDRKKTRY